MGSVKDLDIIKQPGEKAAGIGRFVFSDRYSVFDWGEMPDHILNKGSAICLATAYFFEKAEELGIKTHYLGVVENGKPKKLNDLTQPSNTIEVKILRVIKPQLTGDGYDYSIFQKERNNFLIPLEVIYRNALPAGSSVFKRLHQGTLKLSDIGLDKMPEPGQVLDKPIYDVSTKLEVTDRYLSWDEAKRISVLSDAELDEMKKMVANVNELITKETRRLDLFNEDGKIELGFDENRNFVLVDALGTLDECRFTYEGLPVSKEVARIYYRSTDWFKDVEEAKKNDRVNWKTNVKTSPPRLPEELYNAISTIYQAYTNELTKRRWFDVPSLVEALRVVKKYQ
ncbi:MAG TPA: phosphoribosylaminoimidazolesuccinocarboxamide synthase [candidate division WOR-3 bacterium]|uniref:Phosphoribosylaminoimidazole-succinocarboxamide synthase n=1 Tax=candidate division WOR-3 bacterium TaxID=2052148 RepID=A0A9C9ENW9_UNCW3|nr:phosphoribosylaminoimidazolesuccinocarboxamide synthase [candidate division WOR-3 bacterium]